ncbi:MAG TPA: U32 family peptidase [Elusimicrobiales bacterium]|nr:U32 family peptidase [Elusimicrobiales bacterium]
MKIVSCFSSLDEIKPLAKAGADELYCAVPGLPSFGEPALLTGAGGLKAAVRAAHALGLKISLAVNSLGEASFTRPGEGRLLRRLAAADAAGVDAFIVASPAILGLLLALKRRRARLHLSSVQPCFSSLSAAFFLDLGISRIILPNQLAPYEARKIVELCRRRGAELEIFDHRFFGCAYINGRCHLHRPDYYTLNASVQNGSMCRLNISAGALQTPGAIDVDAAWKPRLGPIVRRLSSRLACGGAPRIANMAAFFEFFAAGVGYLKYGTRQDPGAVKVRKVREVRAMLDAAETVLGKYPRAEAQRRFMEKMQNWDGRKY